MNLYQLNDIEGNPIGLYQSSFDTVDTQNLFDNTIEKAENLEDIDCGNLQSYVDEILEEDNIYRVFAQNIDSNLE